MSNKTKYKIKFIFSTLIIPISQIILDKCIPEDNSYGIYGYFIYSRHSIYFALAILLTALYFLFMYLLEEYKELKNK